MKYHTVQALLDDNALVPHFQPIVRLDQGHIVGHEALIRTPKDDCPWATPDGLFAAARAQGLSLFLEIACVRAALWRWAQVGGRGRLFLNLSAEALVAAMAQRTLQAVLDLLPSHGVSAGAVVIELTEHERVQDFGALAVAVQRLRRRGIALALDDFGDGRSSLRLWSELKPEIVKIDKYFVHDLPSSADKLQTLRALLQISVTLGAEVVAEGVETLEELRILRDLGLSLGQGWLFGRPGPDPALTVPPAVRDVLQAPDVAVLPQRARAGNNGRTAQTLLVEAPPIARQATMEQLFSHFQAHREAPGVALVDEQERVHGLFPRERFTSLYAQPYFREVHGRRAALAHAVSPPLSIDVDTGVESLTAVLTRPDQRYLTDGFVLVQSGRYRGLGRSEALVRLVTEARIEAARHANPLTLLPGNLPVSEHLRRLLVRGVPFVACHADLNHFKPFNDHYGYWRGDEMIRLLAGIVLAHADPRRDFVGHIGGDDFVLLFQSEDWHARCARIVEQFDRRARPLFDAQALTLGGLQAEDRHGQLRLHPLTTLSIGAVRVAPGDFHEPEEVAAAAAAAKRLAKKGRLGVHVDGVAVG